ncbi:uncharacterized protein F5891DRAFT_1201791 [Suillus fuscotomentosus]|uniref:Uncharacterized protein n=1 Tax=Suillus fuscotomentosus TaxID=1912939 RepID=A0AAD4HAW6_9AGAM|nr:uncharacterized protein F5891DRAFT_1201791 [Suillus fuscotomentosus]KAG1885350.1 hypothetical protein F5891DRAFT_1201791 [Suillus fuscotomentosus]
MNSDNMEIDSVEIDTYPMDIDEPLGDVSMDNDEAQGVFFDVLKNYPMDVDEEWGQDVSIDEVQKDTNYDSMDVDDNEGEDLMEVDL